MRPTSSHLASIVALTLCIGCNTTATRPPVPQEPQQNQQGNDERSSRREERRDQRRDERRNGQPDSSGQASAQNSDPSVRRGNHAAIDSTAGHFDFYLLNLSWNPEYCATHTAAAECAAHSGFVVHGLWPQNNDGTFPENCSKAPGPINPSQYLDLQPTISLIAHEWQTHGTCSGLAPDAYFQAIRKVYHQVVIPAPWRPGDATPAMLTPQAILAQFANANPADPQGTFALTCGSNRLTALEACFTTGLTPESCQGVRSCKANVVKITAP